MDHHNQIEHNGVLSQSLNGFRKDRTMCDVTIVVGEKEFPAHRLILSAASNYYKTMFNVEMKENVTGKVEMHDISVVTFKLCIEYIYTGFINIHADNVYDLLRASSLQQIQDLKNLCLVFIQNNLTVKTCLESFNMSKLYENDELRRNVENFIVDNFQQVTKCSEFNEFIDDETLGKMISSENIVIPSEKALYDILNSWIQFDVENREKYFVDLFHHLRLSNSPVDFLCSLISEERVKNNQKCFKLVQEAISQASSGKSTRMKRMRNKVEGKRLMVMKKKASLDENPILSFVPDDFSWKSFPKGPKALAVACAVLENKLYAVGSKLEMNILDLVENTWSSTATAIDFDGGNFALTVYQGRLHLVGGLKYEKYVHYRQPASVMSRRFQEYSMVKKKWQAKQLMQSGRNSPTASSIGGTLYVFGGNSTSEKFDGNNWNFLCQVENASSIQLTAVKDGQ